MIPYQFFVIIIYFVYFQIKTLRLATSYISYLAGVLETDEPVGGFRAELAGCNSGRRSLIGNDIQISSSDSTTLQENEIQQKLDVPTVSTIFIILTK